jgi:transcriptional regulator with XRE-family HTH domain
MTGTTGLVQGVKARLRAQGMTYRELARRLRLSEPTIKRDLARGNFSLHRLDRICEVLGVSIEELLSPPGTTPLTELTEEQEHALVSSPKLLIVTYLIVNDWKFPEIIATFRLDANELLDVLLKLDRLKIVDFRPPARVRKLTARNFSWRKDGPVQAYFLRRIIPEFLNADFETAGDEMRFVAGTLSAASMLRFQMSLRRVADEFEQLAHQDSRLPLDDRDGCSAILAFRRWEFSEFAKLRRIPRTRRSANVRVG